jgi:hypothetical protein
VSRPLSKGGGSYSRDEEAWEDEDEGGSSNGDVLGGIDARSDGSESPSARKDRLQRGRAARAKEARERRRLVRESVARLTQPYSKRKEGGSDAHNKRHTHAQSVEVSALLSDVQNCTFAPQSYAMQVKRRSDGKSRGSRLGDDDEDDEQPSGLGGYPGKKSKTKNGEFKHSSFLSRLPIYVDEYRSKRGIVNQKDYPFQMTAAKSFRPKTGECVVCM